MSLNSDLLQSSPVAIIGLGYVGLPLAVAFGKQRPVIGFDINTDRIAQLNAGEDATQETTPAQLAAATQLRFTSDVADLAACRTFIVTVPTPVDEALQPDLRPLESASATVGRVLKAGDVVIYESTVYPGATEEVCVPILEQVSGLRYLCDGACPPGPADPAIGNAPDACAEQGEGQGCSEGPSRAKPVPLGGSGPDASAGERGGQGCSEGPPRAKPAPLGGSGPGACAGERGGQFFHCGYSPERINPGDKVNTLETITKITSGSTPAAAAYVDQLYASIVTAGTYRASSIRVAEAAKVIENTQRDLNIAFVNELSVLFARLELDTLEVLEAAGSKWNFLPFKPGLVGGHCIGVDPYYLTHKAQAVGYNPQVILAGRRINDNMARYVARNVIRLMLQGGLDAPRCRVGVLGITFKENCPDVRNSKVVDMVREFEGWGMQVVVSDPVADPAEVQAAYGIPLQAIDADHPVDVLVVAVGHSAYRALTPAQLKALVRGPQPVLADVKSLYDRHALAALGFSVFRL
ncbi:nucleotide sugar dehydrogenase [Comamonas serinivorans]|uniref:Nucleotide sugar dehydrogenase n=1 Tax=Comamonas serinivorans TaxID=1082851 RepID=A0A1Y0EL97_9BURK|nr:nucleotide sugar dehydrogenase [Comamonas serinivorans]ARU04221.1 nucleotide sugar dehydrogenase [Comamonas serinivorans]